MSTPAIITLTTDFGLGSPYVAQMKGVILSHCRAAVLVDITHSVGPQNIREGAIVLADATPRFPPGTIHVAVVDPGVGTARRLIHAEIGGQRYLAPDNGLLSLLAKRRANSGGMRIVALENSELWLPQPSNTFHGRDILAPVAAHLALGGPPEKLGPRRSEIVMLEWPTAQFSAGGISGEVLYVDSFGNLITNIEERELTALGNSSSLVVECRDRTIRGLVRTYGAAMAGELVALIGSQNCLEISLVEGNAAKDLQVRAGEAVRVT